jgi:hypothetical protein
MAFDAAMKSMGGKMKPKSAKSPDEHMGKEKPEPKGKTEGEESGGGMSIDKSEGGYKTSDGQEHGHLGAALMHVANHHEPGGKHLHMHHDGMGITSHGVHEGGEHDGPHEHSSPEEAGQHAASFLADQSVGGGDEMTGGQQQAPQHSMSGF